MIVNGLCKHNNDKRYCKKCKKEYIEVFQSGRTFLINDFGEMKIFGEKEEKIKLSKQDKGHTSEIKINGSPNQRNFRERKEVKI